MEQMIHSRIPKALAPCLILAFLLCAVPVRASESVTDSPSHTFQNVVHVAKSGGDFTFVWQALASISDNSVTNPYLIKVGPGVYLERFTMKPYVDIEGSGKEVTVIVAPGGNTYSTAATVVGANHAEIRNLAIKNYGGLNYSVGLYCWGTMPSVRDVYMRVSGGNYNYGAYLDSGAAPDMAGLKIESVGGTGAYGVTMIGCSPEIAGGSIKAFDASGDNCGVVSNSSSPVLSDLTISGQNGSNAIALANISSGRPLVKDCRLIAGGGSTNSTSVYNLILGSIPGARLENCSLESTVSLTNLSVYPGVTYHVYLSHCRLDGTVQKGGSGSSVNHCNACYNSSFAALSTACQ